MSKAAFVYDDYRETFARRVPIRPRKPGPLIAWDLETTNVPKRKDDPMSVDLRYLTVHGERIRLSQRLDSPDGEAILARAFDALFIPGFKKARFVAWNANRFDTLFLLRAIVRHRPDLIVRPMEAKQGGLRGARVIRRDDPKVWWDLCDGIAMTGIQSTLAEFTKKFSPELHKLEGVIDFDRESFDPDNPRHVEYAERDSEALFVAMTKVDAIVESLTKRKLTMTIGGLGIRYFEANIPEGVAIRPVPDELWNDMFAYVMRGGYVFVKHQHDGPTWQVDVNQAYAAAMREERLPAGNAIRTRMEVPNVVGVYRCRIHRDRRSPVPFYCKRASIQRDPSSDDGRTAADRKRDAIGETRLRSSRLEVDGEPVECYGEPVVTYITTTEVAALRRWGWTVIVEEGWVWTKTFSMRTMVDDLESLRTTCRSVCKPGRCACANDAIGTMVKYIGCNCYGKTAERMDTRVLVLSAGGKPDSPIEGAITDWMPHEKWIDYAMGLDGGDSAFQNFWVCYVKEVDRRRYHRPHVAAFITAHVRMKLFDAINAQPDGFLKADTDSLAWDRPIEHLDIDPKRYGAFKSEWEGTRMVIVGKKVYAIVGEGPANAEPVKAVCKGLNVKRLLTGDYEAWVRTGDPPIQSQVQMLGWRRGLPSSRYRALDRRGTDFRRVAPHLFEVA